MPIGPIKTCSQWRRTEKRRHRLDWRGRLILQVMDEQDTGYIKICGEKIWNGKRVSWRDAKLSDIQDEVV